MLLPDHMIRLQKIVTPFKETQVRPGVISYGVSSYGYDARLGSQFKVLKPYCESVIDPKRINPGLFDDVTALDYLDLLPGGFALGNTVERFKIPRDVLAICLGKSTYARCGVMVNVTPLEPEWEGHVTLEIHNLTPYPVRIYVGEGICQFVFLQALMSCSLSYADKLGKYQDQEARPVLAKVD